jgi:hypothetical protein
MSKSEQAKQLARDVEQSNNENASELKGAMNGGCSPELSKQATGTMVAVMGVVDKVNRALTTTGGSDVSSLFSDDSLQKIYENAKKSNNNSLLKEYLAEQNYIINKYGPNPDSLSRGTNEYNDLLSNRYRAQGTKDLEELNNKYIEVNNLIMDLIKVIQQQKIAVENMQKVMQNLDEKNEELLSMINGGKSDLYTYNRKSMYQSKLNENVENLTFIPVVVYWTLVILWICIVMIYLRNVTIVSVLILVGLILYPYFSTPIFLWILEKIQMVWNFIFAAVHNRISV